MTCTDKTGARAKIGSPLASASAADLADTCGRDIPRHPKQFQTTLSVVVTAQNPAHTLIG